MSTAILWFRRDLRLTDNPALLAALRHCQRIVPLYIHAPAEEAPWQPGAASRWWLHHALAALQRDLQRLGSALLIRHGPTQEALAELGAACGATHLYWNRLYDPATIARDTAIKRWAQAQGLSVESHNAGLLHEPWTLQTGKGEPYRVFTPFWKAGRAQAQPAAPEPAPTRLPPLPAGLATQPLETLELLPRVPWDAGLAAAWTPGEPGAQTALDAFMAQGADHYRDVRDLPGRPGTSRLSPHLHFGELGPRQVLQACRNAGDSSGAEAYARQLYWREFGHHLLYHFPYTAEQPLDRRFAEFPWARDITEPLAAWQQGRTGIPIVDAGMRELWHTGWMHNRVRMLVASLLTKNLLIPWQQGARWFWDTLVDADLANNTLGWQWTAGCGADAAPYFRIFNPVLQGQRFDGAGSYVRRWVPELARLPDQWLHQPWEAPAAVLTQAAVRLGSDYPEPMVDLRQTRERALAVWEDLKGR
jgi:deoxyribodipyrimidine photo-lyase